MEREEREEQGKDTKTPRAVVDDVRRPKSDDGLCLDALRVHHFFCLHFNSVYV
jgi:hypothetical protein